MAPSKNGDNLIGYGKASVGTLKLCTYHSKLKDKKKGYTGYPENIEKNLGVHG